MSTTVHNETCHEQVLFNRGNIGAIGVKGQHSTTLLLDPITYALFRASEMQAWQPGTRFNVESVL